MLLDRGARLDLRDDLLKSTPLGWACRWGRLEMAEVLIGRGALVEEPDTETGLHQSPGPGEGAIAKSFGCSMAMEVRGVGLLCTETGVRLRICLGNSSALKLRQF